MSTRRTRTLTADPERLARFEGHLGSDAGFAANNPELSPDGKWMAYDSDETGRREVYLADFPAAERRTRVSTEGGFAPVWSGDGTELFYATTGSDAIVAASFATDGENRPVLGRPETLFSVDMKRHNARQFDTRDGKRFLINARVNTGARTPLTLVVNWADGL